MADDSNTAVKTGLVVGGLGLLAAAIFGSKAKKPAPAMAGPQPPKLRKGCNCGR